MLVADSRFDDFKRQVLDDFFEQTKLAEESRDLESKAATTIQSFYRMYIVRRGLSELNDKAILIQKAYRARLAKKRFQCVLQEHVIRLRVKYFNQQATCIQKHYRAFMSRKYKHDFYARKEYIKQVTKKSEEVVQLMRESNKKQLQDEEKRSLEESQREFGKIIRKLHHLISTECCASIFNSPYTALTGGPPMIAGLHVEEYLKMVRKGQYAKKFEKTLDASAGIGMDKSFEESFAETKERFAGRTPITYKPFICAGSSKNVLTSEPTLRASTPYKSTAQREAQAKANAAKGNIIDKPFVTAFRKGQLFEDTLFE